MYLTISKNIHRLASACSLQNCRAPHWPEPLQVQTGRLHLQKYEIFWKQRKFLEKKIKLIEICEECKEQ